MSLRSRIARLEQSIPAYVVLDRRVFLKKFQELFARTDDDALRSRRGVIDILDEINARRLAQAGIPKNEDPLVSLMRRLREQLNQEIGQ